MKKLGFTLAEVLITLGIIGVVAALTTPALVKNSRAVKVGPSLAKFVNTFETGLEQMMHKESIQELNSSELLLLPQYIVMNKFDGTYKFTDALGKNSYPITSNVSELERILAAVPAEETQNDNVQRVYALALCVANGLTSPVVFQLKGGQILAIIPMEGMGESISNSGKGSYEGCIAEIIYDIDGNNEPNKAGKDVFDFFLDKNGILVPVGSGAHRDLKWKGIYASKIVRDKNGSMEYSSDMSTCNTKTSDLSENFACTGKMADKNWKSD